MRIGTGLVPVFHQTWVPSPYMLSQMNCVPSSEMCQVIAAQNRLMSMAMSSAAVTSSHPLMLRNQRPSSTYLSHIARAGDSTAALGYGDLFQSNSLRPVPMRLPREQSSRNPAAEALAMLRLPEQSNSNRANIPDSSLLSSFSLP